MSVFEKKNESTKQHIHFRLASILGNYLIDSLNFPQSDGAQTQGWHWSPCRSRSSVGPEQETTDHPKDVKRVPHPTWSNWAQNIISFFHLDLRFINMSNDIPFFSLWPEGHSEILETNQWSSSFYTSFYLSNLGLMLPNQLASSWPNHTSNSSSGSSCSSSWGKFPSCLG